jgi:hypothetical protein
LPEPLSPVIRIEASDGGHLVGQADDVAHGRIADDHRTVVVGDGGQDGGDQLGVRRQRDEFLGPGLDRRGGPHRIGVDAAGHHRHPDPLGLVGGDQARDVERVVDHQQVGPLPGPQRVGRGFARFDVRDLGPGVHRHFHGDRELSVQFSDDQEAHRSISVGTCFTPAVQLVKLTRRRCRPSRRRRRP